MPELPEVETVRRGLAPHLVGRRIVRVDQRRPDLRWPMPPDLVQVLTGAQVTGLRRRSKYILADLDRDAALLLHLGMSGRVRIEGEGLGQFHHDPAVLPRHDHLVLTTEDGTTITAQCTATTFVLLDKPAAAKRPGARPGAPAAARPPAAAQ